MNRNSGVARTCDVATKSHYFLVFKSSQHAQLVPTDGSHTHSISPPSFKHIPHRDSRVTTTRLNRRSTIFFQQPEGRTNLKRTWELGAGSHHEKERPTAPGQFLQQSTHVFSHLVQALKQHCAVTTVKGSQHWTSILERLKSKVPRSLSNMTLSLLSACIQNTDVGCVKQLRAQSEGA